MTIKILIGDISELMVVAIVNSAIPSLHTGGCVCGVIHRAAGPELEMACKAIGKCAVGHALKSTSEWMAAYLCEAFLARTCPTASRLQLPRRETMNSKSRNGRSGREEI